MLYRRWLPIIARFHLTRVRDAETASELTAETFAELAASLGRFDASRGAAPAWVLAIASHKSNSSLRRRRVEARARRALGSARAAAEEDELVRVEQLASLAGEPRVRALLAQLPAEQREAVRSRVLDERSYTEIARELRCSQAVVRQRVHRGLARLKRLVADGS